MSLPVEEVPACPKCGWHNFIQLAGGKVRCVHCLHEFDDPRPKPKKPVTL